MPYAMVPPGYSPLLLASLRGISAGVFTPLEESVSEGALMLMRVDLEAYPTSEELAGLEEGLAKANVPTWPGYEYRVYTDSSRPSFYVAWVKGFAWLPVIVGLIGSIIAVPIVGTVLWWIIPDEVKQMINAIVMLLVIGGVMLVMMPLLKEGS